MQVIIGGVSHVPLGSVGGDEVGKAIIEMLVSGYYHGLDCHKTGNEALARGCDCGGCQAYQLAVQYLGSVPESKEIPIIDRLLKELP